MQQPTVPSASVQLVGTPPPPEDELEVLLLDELVDVVEEVELDEDVPVSQRSGYVPLGSASEGGATQSYSPSAALQPQTVPAVHVCSVTVVLEEVWQ